MVTGLRPETFTNLQLNAGIFVTELDHSAITTASALKTAIQNAIAAGKILGATVGDGSFQATPETRQIEANGMRYPIKGSTVIDSWDVRLTGTMKEINASNMDLALMTADKSTSGDVTTITLHTDLVSADYMPDLIWIGDTSDGGLVLIDLKNVLNISGANMTFTDKGEGSLPFEFRAHCATLAEMSSAPVTIKFFRGTDNSSVTDLASLVISGVTLSPAFSADTTLYEATTTSASNTVTATAADSGAAVALSVNNTSKSSGASISWESGSNTVVATVTKSGAPTKVYKVFVTKS